MCIRDRSKSVRRRLFVAHAVNPLYMSYSVVCTVIWNPSFFSCAFSVAQLTLQTPSFVDIERRACKQLPLVEKCSTCGCEGSSNNGFPVSHVAGTFTMHSSWNAVWLQCVIALSGSSSDSCYDMPRVCEFCQLCTAEQLAAVSLLVEHCRCNTFTLKS